MKKFSCPSCGAEIAFQSSVSVFTVCKSCRSTLVRKDMDLESLGKMADLKEDATVFQIGTTGRHHGEFLIIGRVRVSWADGFWNEWFIRYDDGRDGWLAEAQGFLMVSFRVDPTPTLPNATQLHSGHPIKISGADYLIDDVKEVTYSFAEGELPFVAPQGFKGTSIDLRRGENEFASISIGQGGDTDVFLGHYVQFDQLHFKNLKEIDGW